MFALQTVALLLAGSSVVRATYVADWELRPTYDYIVIGAGTAGATVASRLSETNATVLLIEAGELDKGEEIVLVPRQAGAARYTPYDWNYTTVGYPAMNNRVIAIPQGKVVGGSSVLNGMAFDRGAAADYDAWADLGNPGWSFKELLPYFKKAEKFTPPPKDLADKYNITWDLEAHGTTGPIHSSYPDTFTVQTQLFKQALDTLGIYKQVEGHGGNAFGNFWSPNALDAINKTRSYSRNYVELAINRTNFHVLLARQASKLVTEKVGDSIRITGVEFTWATNATKKIANVTREVILSGGVIGSPRLLQVSGIGPAAVLQAAKVPVVLDLPGVGTNYQDHGYIFTSGALTNAPSEPTYSNDQARQMYYTNKTGPWTVSGPTNFAFVPFSKLSPKSNDILDALAKQDAAAYLVNGTHSTVIAGYDAQKKVLVQHLSTETMAISELVLLGGGGHLVSQQHPFSRGYVSINSNDPFEYPTIDLRYAANPLDFNVVAETIRFTRKIMTTPVMAAMNFTELSPGAAISTDDQMNAYISRTLSTMFHSCCTNPMQPLAQGGVVDSKLKVFGTSNLRIADVSIMPLIPATHLQSSAYAIGEKAADLVKADYNPAM